MRKVFHDRVDQVRYLYDFIARLKKRNKKLLQQIAELKAKNNGS